MDQRIESFLADVLAVAGQDPDAIRAVVRDALADCEARGGQNVSLAKKAVGTTIFGFTPRVPRSARRPRLGGHWAGRRLPACGL
jgi:hypothetical protein